MKTETHSVIEGAFVDYKRYVRQNKTIFHIEVPIEYTNKYISILGEPTAANPISVAVARLNIQDDIPAINLPVMQLGEGGGGERYPRSVAVSSDDAATTADFNAKVDRACADNPDLPRQFVKEILLAKEDDSPSVPYEFGEIPDWRV